MGYELVKTQVAPGFWRKVDLQEWGGYAPLSHSTGDVVLDITITVHGVGWVLHQRDHFLSYVDV